MHLLGDAVVPTIGHTEGLRSIEPQGAAKMFNMSPIYFGEWASGCSYRPYTAFPVSHRRPLDW